MLRAVVVEWTTCIVWTLVPFFLKRPYGGMEVPYGASKASKANPSPSPAQPLYLSRGVPPLANATPVALQGSAQKIERFNFLNRSIFCAPGGCRRMDYLH